ncbi:MAG: hypothetical protein ABI318_13190, partial [Chthoniobacteraceae bacterium]
LNPKEAAAEQTDHNAQPGATDAIVRRLNAIIFPKIDFRDATVREAIEFVAIKSKTLDPDHHGVNIVLKLGDGGGVAAGSHPAGNIPGLESARVPNIPGGNANGVSETRITLTLNNVPLLEVIKYITNLANLKYRIEPYAITIVPIGTQTEELFIKQWKVPPGLLSKQPTTTSQTAGVIPPGGAPSAKDFLAASGVTFGQGAFAMYSPASNTLIVKDTQEQLDLVERIIDVGSAGPAANDTPAAGAIAAAAPPNPAFVAGSIWDTPRVRKYFDDGRKTAGLLPVTLDLPRSGRVLVFEGLYAPERLVMRYDDWWSRARALWMWFVSGGIALWLLAGRRPWWRTLWAVLVLTAVPLCVSAAWTPVCNALLGGWLAGLMLNRIGARGVFRERKEVLA